MEKIKFDRVRKQIKIDGKIFKAQELDYFIQQNTFDKHKSMFFNKSGFTYILENEAGEQDEEIFFPINLQYQDTPEQARLLKIKSQEEINEINAIKEEYGY